jgi:hypothetical protein
MKKNTVQIKHSLLLIFLLLSTFFNSKLFAQTCSNCTVTLANSNQFDNIIIASGQTYCIPNNVTFRGTINLQAGGTLCIASGGNFGSNNSNPNITGFNGNVINNGTMRFVFFTNYTPNIQNFGTLNTTGMQGFAGILNNSGTVNLNGFHTFVSGAVINNSGTFNKNSGGEFVNVAMTNSGTLNLDNSFFLNGGSLTNTVTGTANVTMNSGSSQFSGSIENSGTMNIRNATSGNGINTLVNNYGLMRFYDQVNLGTNTNMTNDNQMEFINVSVVNYLGTVLTNNGNLLIPNGSLNFNSVNSQFINNALLQASGSVAHNATNTYLRNNCRIIAQNYTINGGKTDNHGIIDVSNLVSINGTGRILENMSTGFIKGANFTNSGTVTGFGNFYFTGTTNNNGGVFAGSSATNPILFFDTTSTGNVFDVGNAPTNTIRPASMTPQQTNEFDCNAIPPSTSGYPPTTIPYEAEFCTEETLSFSLADLVSPHPNVNGQSFTVQNNSIRLFEFGNNTNPTNNSTVLNIAGKGTLTANTTTGEITFTRNPAFESGVLEAEYRITNTWSGNPTQNPSGRTKITLTIDCVCGKFPNIEISELKSNIGISTLETQVNGWPENIFNAFIVLESKNKGFVISRVANENAIANPEEGMLIYDIEADCVKLFDGSEWNCIRQFCQ